jgi:hypothetical protein
LMAPDPPDEIHESPVCDPEETAEQP